MCARLTSYLLRRAEWLTLVTLTTILHEDDLTGVEASVGKIRALATSESTDAYWLSRFTDPKARSSCRLVSLYDWGKLLPLD